jgi:diaminopimelate decarboxylase
VSGARLTEHITAGPGGRLLVEDCDAVALAERFGTPLYVVSEAQLRTNHRRIHTAFASRYPVAVDVLFSTKANFTPAVMRVLAQEGAGAEVYTEGELYLALLGGAEPARIVLNDADKPLPYLRMGLEAGAIVNVDSVDELVQLEELALRAGTVGRVFIRLRLPLRRLDVLPNQWDPEAKIGDAIRGYKLGAHWEEALEIARHALRSASLALLGAHFHLGRWGNDPRYHCLMLEELAEWLGRFEAEAGWSPEIVNVGGGFVHGRPEGNGPQNADREIPSVEEYAERMVDTFAGELARRRLALPLLQLEPGRYLTENAGVLLTRVGAVRRWEDRTWILVDARGQHLAAVDSPQQWHYHAVVADRADAAATQTADIVGRGCSFELLGADRALPAVQAGDVVAFLDTGAYTETKAATMNAAPRPASVLVSGSDAEIVTVAENLAALAARFRIPARLLAGAPASADVAGPR